MKRYSSEYVPCTLLVSGSGHGGHWTLAQQHSNDNIHIIGSRGGDNLTGGGNGERMCTVWGLGHSVRSLGLAIRMALLCTALPQPPTLWPHPVWAGDVWRLKTMSLHL